MGEIESKVESSFLGVHPAERQLWAQWFKLDDRAHAVDVSDHHATEIIRIDTPEEAHELAFLAPNLVRSERLLVMRSHYGGFKEDFRYYSFSLPGALAKLATANSELHGLEAVCAIATRLEEVQQKLDEAPDESRVWVIKAHKG